MQIKFILFNEEGQDFYLIGIELPAKNDGVKTIKDQKMHDCSNNIIAQNC